MRNNSFSLLSMYLWILTLLWMSQRQISSVLETFPHYLAIISRRYYRKSSQSQSILHANNLGSNYSIYEVLWRTIQSSYSFYYFFRLFIQRAVQRLLSITLKIRQSIFRLNSNLPFLFQIYLTIYSHSFATFTSNVLSRASIVLANFINSLNYLFYGCPSFYLSSPIFLSYFYLFYFFICIGGLCLLRVFFWLGDLNLFFSLPLPPYYLFFICQRGFAFENIPTLDQINCFGLLELGDLCARELLEKQTLATNDSAYFFILLIGCLTFLEFQFDFMN